MLDIGYRLACRNARTICYVEIEAFAQAVLVARIKDGLLDDAPLWSDLKTFDCQPWRGTVDTVIGGFPCQPFSNAGRKQGTADPRHLWPYISHVIKEIQPSECFFENVDGLLSTQSPDGRYAYEIVQQDLRDMGYEVEAGLFSANQVGAPHRRVRLFILAYSQSTRTRDQRRTTRGRSWTQDVRQGDGQTSTGWSNATGSHLEDSRCEYGESGSEVTGLLRGQPGERDTRLESERPSRTSMVESKSIQREWKFGEGTSAWESQAETRDASGNMDDSFQSRLEGHGVDRERSYQLPAWPPSPTSTDEWREILERDSTVEPAIRRVVDGMDTKLDTSIYAYSQDRLRAIGNGVVPYTVALAYEVLSRRIKN